MFSGIIEEVGKIKRISPSGRMSTCEITGKNVFDDIKEGDSISVNGVCLTVEQLKGNVLSVSLSSQTLKETNLAEVRAGDYVNLERALRQGDRVGGHILTGHIDFKTPIRHLYKDKNSGLLVFSIPEKFQRYVVQRGSIGV
ncbi:MAG: riboflavin synthase, partial [Candidatus Ratteibacteria bacterium]|nr:riboflavin synthase [Candidatus Ratteibacteria bacterium]